MKQNIFQPYLVKIAFIIFLISSIIGCINFKNNKEGNYPIKKIKLSDLIILRSDSNSFKSMFMYYCVYHCKPIMIFYDKNCDDCIDKFNKIKNIEIYVIQQDKYFDYDYWLPHYKFSYATRDGQMLINKDVMLYKLVK